MAEVGRYQFCSVDHKTVATVIHTHTMRSKHLTPLLLTAMLLALAGTARAQGPELGVSYSYGRVTNGDGFNLPAGFLLSIAGGGSESPWLVGEIGGNFRSERGVTFKLFTVQGGVRFFTDLNKDVRPFAQLLVGLASLRARGDSDNKVAIEPAAGVDFSISRGVAFRAGVGVPIIVTEGENLKVVRLNVGLVFGGR